MPREKRRAYAVHAACRGHCWRRRRTRRPSGGPGRQARRRGPAVPAAASRPACRRASHVERSEADDTAAAVASDWPAVCASADNLHDHRPPTVTTVLYFYAPAQGALSDDAVWRLTSVCLTSVAYIRSAGGVCGRPAAWRVFADRARLGRPGSRLPLRASVAGLGGGISWRPPAYSVSFIKSTKQQKPAVRPILGQL